MMAQLKLKVEDQLCNSGNYFLSDLDNDTTDTTILYDTVNL